MTGIFYASLIILLMPAVAAAVTIAAHIAVSRYYPHFGIYRGQFVGFAAGLFAVAILATLALFLNPRLIGQSLASILIFLCFIYVYFHFNNMGETARRIRLLRDLVTAGQPLSFDDLTARYSAHEIIERRLSRLIAAGQVRKIDSRYIIANRSVYLMVWLVGAAHWIVFGYRRVNPVR
jgi:hypothetical protein